MSHLISLVIPFFNEQESLVELIPAVQEAVAEISWDFEIILVNDCSTDDSVKVVKSFAKNDPKIKLLQLEQKGGQTGCFKAAFKVAHGDYIIRMDADLQDDPHDLPLFIAKIEEGYDMILGLRTSRKHNHILRIISAGFDFLVLLLVDTPLHAHSASFLAVKAGFVKDIPYRNNDHRYIPLIALRRGATKATEVIVRHHYRKYGSSNYKLFRKLVLGIPEGLFFLLRLQFGVYNSK